MVIIISFFSDLFHYKFKYKNIVLIAIFFNNIGMNNIGMNNIGINYFKLV